MSGGPVTRDTSSLALGLAKILVGVSATNIASVGQTLNKTTDSIGSMANTKFFHEIEYWKHFSGFPQLEDHVIPLRGTARIEGGLEEISPKTLALALGNDIATGYAEAHSGQIGLGALVSPDYIRMEAIYEFPNTDEMFVVFPRAQVESSVEIDWQKEEAASIPVSFVAKRADSAVSGGSAVWDSMPLGVILFEDNTP